MITVHHLNHSRSHRVLWLLEELELLYELKRYPRDPKTMLAPAELKAVHPLGKSPVITDDDLTLAESAAILEYLLERYGNGRLMPQGGTPEYRRVRYWMQYAEGSALPPLLMRLVIDRGARIGAALGDGIRPAIEQACEALGVEWVCGATVVSVDPAGVQLDNGQRIDASTVVWTVGFKANPLTEQISEWSGDNESTYR